MKVINKLESYPTGDMLVPYCPNCDNPTYSERKCPFCNTELEYEEMIEKDKEIEHLNTELNRSNNIINELEKYINENYIYDEVGMKIFDASTLQDKLQELKADIEEYRDSTTWWSNRFNAVERDNRELRKEIERLHSIIKEVREKIEGVRILGLRSGKTLIATLLNDILEILDKENNNE